MRIVIAVLLVATVLLTGCCQLSQNHVMAGYDLDGEVVLVVERRNGEHCIWPQQSVSAPDSECVEFEKWDDWRAVFDLRKQLGIPLDICTYCQSGYYVCPPEEQE